MQTIVFATNNAHKAREVEMILAGQYIVKTLKDIGCNEDIAETADTLEGNAILKARYVKDNFGYDCFSEDTGLEVEALGGDPGVHTARYAGEQRSADDNIAKLLANLADKSNRKARFRAVIALVRGDDAPLLLDGSCHGHIATEKHGDGGFGYDPVFVPDGYEAPFAVLSADVKNQISHRAHAVAALTDFLSRI